MIGAQTLHATGYAMGIQRDGAVGTGDPDRDAAVIAHFGDGASSQGDVNEAFIFAASYNAPVVFFCQNNQWAISEPIERQTRIPLYQRALGFGFPGVRVDGNDVLATYAVTKAALQRARDGQGPTFVEAYTYRMGAHTTTDDPTRYRLSDDVEHWKLKDPIARVKVYLTPQRPRRRRLLRRRRGRRPTSSAHHLREGCKALPDPKPLDMFDHVYAEQTDGAGRAARAATRPTSRPSRGPRLDEHRRRSRSPRASTWACARRWRTTRRSCIMGEDVGKLGGVFRITDGLQKDFGEDRVIDSPARRVRHRRHRGRAWRMRGYRPVVEIQFDGFVYPAYDQIVCQVAKMHFRSQGPGQDADGHPDPVRWRHRRGRAPQRVARRRSSRTPRASRWSPAPTRSTATG